MSSSTASPDAAAAPSGAALQLLPFALIIFLGYGTIGLPLAALPVHIHETLGQGPLAVALAVALQPAVTLLSRPWAGGLCDRHGGKIAVLVGVAGAALSGLLYAGAALSADPRIGLALLLLGRAAAGLGEGLMMTGGLAWSIAAVGGPRAGRAMVWVGIAMYGAVAAGGPAGLALRGWGGFGAVAGAVVAAAVLAALVAMPLPAVRGTGGARLPLLRVVGMIWWQGAGLALASVGFGAISAFIAVDFQAEGWGGAGFALSAFGGAYILARLLFGHFPDRFGGARVAAGSLAVQVLGLLLLWAAAVPQVALAGAFLTGAGFSLVFPSFGVEAVKRVPAASRGAALGAYVAFFDVGLAATGPMIGLVVARFGYSAAFAAGALCAALALLSTLRRATS
ncbi:arabinose transporter [Inquilinus limosus]|uniref:MFS transporter n=1 Tax=Inquilinus limosus TaxID=171674 RepID=UPI003F14D31A